MILIIDFGSQTTHLIGRRFRDLGIKVQIFEPNRAYQAVKRLKPAGIILSGGPASVYEKNAPTIGRRIFSLGIPLLGICYGWQLMAKLLNGKVVSGKSEYGPAQLKGKEFSSLLYGFPDTSQVWESHGDSVVKMPQGFSVLGTTERVRFSSVGNETKKWYGVQFHPEASHSRYGQLLFKNFASRICNLALKPKRISVAQIVEEIKEKVGDKRVIGAISGGTDSTVAGTLVAHAIDKQFIPVYVESGLMRAGTKERVSRQLAKLWGVPIIVVKAETIFLNRLKDVVNPEQKRKIIGKLYVELFQAEMKRYKNVQFLLQGTTYADFIHSQGNKRSALIKSHHNVGGLPKKMKLKLLEPIRYFYTDQVRQLGQKLGLSKEIVFQEPFPGPGHAVRIVGAITKKRLRQQQQADAILIEELRQSGWYSKVFQSWTVMTGTNSTAIKGDSRFFGEVVALRVVSSKDRMTADWVRLPNTLLQRIASRIVNEVPNVSRVVYDITTKPPATMEWE